MNMQSYNLIEPQSEQTSRPLAVDVVYGEVHKRSSGDYQFESDSYCFKAVQQGRIESLKVSGIEFLRPCSHLAGGIGWFRHNLPLLHPFSGMRTDYLRFTAEDYGVFLRFSPDLINLDIGYDIPDSQQEYRIYLATDVAVSYSLPGENAAGATLVRCSAPNGTWIEISHNRIITSRDEEGTYLIIFAQAGVRTCGEIRLPRSSWTAQQLTLSLISKAPDHHFCTGKYFVFDVICQTIMLLDQTRDILLRVKILDFQTDAVVYEEGTKVQLIGETNNSSWKIPWDIPGPWRVQLNAIEGGHVIAHHDAIFVYNIDNYLPELYRPTDFWDFWQNAIAEQRNFLIDPSFLLLPEQSDDVCATYEVHITGYAGRRITGIYREPLAPGKYPVIIGVPCGPHLDWVRELPACSLLSYQLDGKATYRTGLQYRYTANFFYNYLDMLRWVDFFASREMADLQQSVYFAGSRGGPIGIALLALDPRIQMCVASVPTNNRWEWQMRNPTGLEWGPNAARYQDDEISFEQVIKQLAYFEPSHFAEYITQPVLISIGLRDELSQVSGNLACYARLAGRKHLCLMPRKGHEVPDEEWYTVAAEWLTELLHHTDNDVISTRRFSTSNTDVDFSLNPYIPSFL